MQFAPEQQVELPIAALLRRYAGNERGRNPMLGVSPAMVGAVSDTVYGNPSEAEFQRARQAR